VPALQTAMRTCCMTGPDNAVFWTLPEALAWGQTRDPPDSFEDFLRTLHELCSSGRVHAIGHRLTGQPRNAFIRIPASDWAELYFDSDGEQLRSEDVFSRILYRRRAWTSVRFSQADLVREWPKAGAAAFVKGEANKYFGDRFRARGKRSIRERSRQEWIDRFDAKQQQVRRWISFVEIADECARAASPVTITEEDQTRALAYRRLVESMARDEFETNGRSQVLLLLPSLDASVPPHRLSHEYFRAMVDAYGAADFTSDSGLVREHLWFCWIPSDLCREWFARHLLAWPDAFNPKDQTLDRSRGNNPNLEISWPPVPDVLVPKKGRRGRKTGSGSFDDDQALREMLRLLASNKAASVLAAAKHVVTAGIAKMTSSNESAVRRLRGKFAARFGIEPPPGKTWSDIARELETK
jgi:hypothetical protein